MYSRSFMVKQALRFFFFLMGQELQPKPTFPTLYTWLISKHLEYH